ncbi:hypothetical protein ACJA88_005404 [Fusarium oxysporum]
MTPAPTGPGSPLIAGAAMSGGDFNDFPDEELGASNLFDFSNSPDTLQSFESLGGNDAKTFLTPQELTGAPLPDSPNGSYQDSSSETASSKRTATPTSKAAMHPAEAMLEEDEMKVEWGNSFFNDDDHFVFGQNHDDASMEMYPFGEPGESILEHPYDMDTASSSPEGLNTEQPALTSQMPTVSSKAPIKDATPKRKKAQGHQKASSMPMPTQFNFNGRCQLKIMPTPLKSRVETQIPIKMTLWPLPPGVTKLHLPPHTISKPKLLSKPTPEKSPDMLELHVSLVCTSAMDEPGVKEAALKRAASHPQGYLPPLPDNNSSQPKGGDVRICQGCITRERKRAARKKIKKPEEEKVWLEDEERRVIVFNTQEVKDWQPPSGVMESTVPEGTMQVDAAMRIACYCRHHGEKMGFNVIFTIKDFQDRVVAQAMSNPIMITDDHKTHPIAQVAAQQPAIPEPPMPSLPQASIENNVLLPPTTNGSFRMSPSNGDLSNMHRSSQASYQSKASSTGNLGRTLSRPASPTLGGPMAKKRKSSASRVPNGLTMTRLDTSPSPGADVNQLSNATSPFTPNLAAFSQADPMFGQQAMAFTTGPPTPSNELPGFYANHRSASMDNMAMAQLYSAPASGHPSRAPSPNGLRNSIVGNPQNQFAQALASTFSVPTGMTPLRAPPVIHKIIPNEGPTVGGIEVTVLGAAFFQGLEIWFGNHKATTTTFWGESSVVCLLPPAPGPGPVPVTFKNQNPQAGQAFLNTAKQPPTFNYLDDGEDKLIRAALSVLGHKMSGQMIDAMDVARRILDNGNGSHWSGGSDGAQGGSSSGGAMFSHAPYAHLESQLLKCLDLIDLDDSMHRTRLDLKRPTGHTMLHLSCSLGYHRLVAALLARGANPDARDRGGFTPLHIASIHNHPEIVRRLMLNGADPTIRSVSGLSASDIAQSRAVIHAIRRSQRHARSRSSGGSGSLHSRASSATSLRSLWEPMTKIHSHEEPISPDSSEESPEYTSGDFEDEDPDEDSYLSMRRPSGFRQDPPFMRRVQQLMPGMAGPRADGEQPQRWWDSSSKAAAPAPPAYEEIFPQESLDQKHESAARAAVEAEADQKCAALFDQTTSTETESAEITEVTEVAEIKTEEPGVLKIGRKNAITKEQQEQFRRAHEVKMKRISSDHNLFFIWIPLLLVMICGMLYSYFPWLFTFAWAFVRSLYQNGLTKTQQLLQQNLPERVLEGVEV